MFIFLLLLIAFTQSVACFDKVVIWGHKLHSHTHSYIHNAFYRAFQHMGYQTYWFDNNDNVQNIDFSNALFITEGQADARIPLLQDGRYILHNCDMKKYQPFFKAGHCITLQVYTDDVLSRPVTKVGDFIYYDLANKSIYMPWATDLLPHEIDTVKKLLPNIKKNNSVWWVGTIWGGEFGNAPEIQSFKKACKENDIEFKQGSGKSIKDTANTIARSYLAPAIVGEWQQKVGYIPCRIFKNISYGQLGITNSLQVYKLFQKKIVYNTDTYQLFYDAKKRMQTITQEELFELIDFVRDNHTYVNRIETLLSFLTLVANTNTQ